MTRLTSTAAALGGTGALMVMLSAAAIGAEASKGAAKDEAVVIGGRTDKPDGTTAISVGRRLPTEWETKVGVDVGLAAPLSATPSPDAYLSALAQQDGSSGVGWASVVAPVAPPGFDKTALEARIDPTQDQGMLSTTLSRSLPLGDGVRLTVKNGYSLTNTLVSPVGPSTSGRPASPPGPVMEQTLATENALSLDLPGATTLAAGAKLSTADDRWLRSLSAEQKLFGGPVSVTGTISERADGEFDRSLKAGFKRQW